MTSGVPGQVLDAYGWVHRPGGDVTVERLPGGLINDTFLVRLADRPHAVVQRLHPIFGAEVNRDLDAITAHLARAGLDTPRLLATRRGDLWVEIDPEPEIESETGAADRAGCPPAHAPRVWRALTHVAGTSVHRVAGPTQARAAGELVGRFHRALRDLDYRYAFTRAGVHDTAGHLARLRRAVERDRPGAPGGGDPDAVALGRAILAMAADLPPPGDLPARHTHGDLKISNVLFHPGAPDRGRCLLDLDTLGRQTMAYELGDAMRSWCNPTAEDDRAPRADPTLFAAAMEGYRAGAGDLLTAAERAAIVPGWETVCVELAARFCVDIFDDRYFGWDSSRYPSRVEHNRARAKNQLELARSVRTQRAALARLA